jgi:hypothetical protein
MISAAAPRDNIKPAQLIALGDNPVLAKTPATGSVKRLAIALRTPDKFAFERALLEAITELPHFYLN